MCVDFRYDWSLIRRAALFSFRRSGHSFRRFGSFIRRSDFFPSLRLFPSLWPFYPSLRLFPSLRHFFPSLRTPPAAFSLLTDSLKKLYKLICLYSSSCYFALLSIVFAIQSPWKRPFSIKISLALFPAAITPAINKPSTFVSIVSGLKKGRPVS